MLIDACCTLRFYCKSVTHSVLKHFYELLLLYFGNHFYSHHYSTNAFYLQIGLGLFNPSGLELAAIKSK